MTELRTLFRLSRTALHLLQGCFTVATLYPFLSERPRLTLKRRWSRQLLSILGVHLRYTGHLVDGHTLPTGLLVANHISFLDIFVVNAVAPAAFVSKDDVRNWPLIGWLSAHTDTLFLARGSRSAAQEARANLVTHLQKGKRVALFPEGTTSRGDTVLPFHSALLQAAIDADTTVTPIVIRYRESTGESSTAPAYVDDISLLQCMRAIAGRRKIFAELSVLSPLTTVATDRRQLSAHAHSLISHTLMQESNTTPSHLSPNVQALSA